MKTQWPRSALMPIDKWILALEAITFTIVSLITLWIVFQILSPRAGLTFDVIKDPAQVRTIQCGENMSYTIHVNVPDPTWFDISESWINQETERRLVGVPITERIEPYGFPRELTATLPIIVPTQIYTGTWWRETTVYSRRTDRIYSYRIPFTVTNSCSN